MRATHLLVPLTIFAAVAAGCGDDDDDRAASTTTSAKSSTAETVEINAVDYRFEELPARVAAGTALSMTNESSVELHELIAYRLDDDDERSADELLSLPEEELGALFAGPPDLGLVAPPGESSFPVLGDGTLTEPGRYLVFCAIPTGADPDEAMTAMQAAVETPDGGPPKIEGGPPHFTQGMYGEIVVE